VQESSRLKSIAAKFEAPVEARHGLKPSPEATAKSLPARREIIFRHREAGIRSIVAGRDVARLLRWIPAIAQIVERNTIGGRPVIGRNKGAIAAKMAAHHLGLGGDGAGQDCQGKSEFD
jgi:hypothetical protein